MSVYPSCEAAALGEHLLRSGRPYEALSAYALAVTSSDVPLPIQIAHESLYRLELPANGSAGAEWARRLLLLALAAKFHDSQARERVRGLASEASLLVTAPVVMLVGSCDSSGQEILARCHPSVLGAFDGFRGTVVSGGTRDGVAGLAGDLRETSASPGWPITIGYVPDVVHDDARVDCDLARYAMIHRTKGVGFSPDEGLQAWVDIVAADCDPTEVVLIGIGGGRISSVEYRVALALGAAVGILEGTGGEAEKLLGDPAWSRSRRLASLAPDATMIRAFVADRKGYS